MANRIQLRRGGAQEWANSNPTLAQGELGIELDTGRFKIGDGVTAWNTLRYERPVESTSSTANTLVQRDADGNFAAGTITATLIGNASTASRLSSSRQIQLSQDITGSAVFDGSQNITINAEFGLVTTLPHYDGTNTATGTYTQVTVDAKGRISNASNPTTLAAYGLDGSVQADEGTKAQPFDLDLKAISDLTTTGILARTSGGNVQTRSVNGTAARIQVNNADGVNGNPTIDLITTTVSAGNYNTASLTSVAGDQTVNASKFTVDDYGRLTSATTIPIATAVEGTTASAYNAGTAYVRYDIITNASKVYQALTSISAGAGAPTHSSGDSGGWRYLAAESTEQKGLASFAQEDFDVSAAGHVTIAAAGVDNTQLQNNKIIFTDGNTLDEFELDNELTTSTAHTGFDYLNYIKINDTSGNLLFGANNTGDGGAGEIDVNVRSYFSDPDITLDGAVNQTLSKTGDGHLTFGLSQNSASNRNLTLSAINTGSGTSNIILSAEDTVQISASEATGKVHVEDARFQDNYIATTNATLNLDPGDDRATTGTVRVWGDLLVDGTTTTVNSTTLQVDDPVITLGGDTAPASDDTKDRGIEFRYYDTQARLGFYGWDNNYTDLGGHEGGYRFMHAATNLSEVFIGTDSGIIAGNVKLTTGTASSSNTTGDLVVSGGAGIGGAVNIGGLLDVDGTFRANSTSRFDDNVVIRGASKTLQLQNGSGTMKIELQSTTGNASIGGVADVTGNFNVNTNKFNVVAASGNTTVAGTLGVTGATTLTGALDLNNAANISGLVHLESTDAPNILSGAPHTIQNNDYGALRVDGGGYFANDVLFNGDIYLNGDFNQQDDSTENFGTRNYLAVRYKIRAGTSAAYTPSYATHGTSNLRVYGGAGIATTLHVGGTSANQGLFVGKRTNSDTVKFSVLGASGNTDIQGTLDVAGATEFNGTVDVDSNFAVRNNTTDKFTVASATGNTVIEGTLNGKGAVDFDSTLNVDGNTTLNGTLTVDGETNITDTLNVSANGEYFRVRNGNNANKFTVDTDNGNTEVMGTLEVDGETRINDTLRLRSNNEAFIVENGSGVDKFTVDSDNGNTNIIGTLTVGDATQINDTLGVSDVVTFTRNTQQTLTGSYAADGAFRLTGGAGIGKNLAVSGDARIYGATELTGALDLNNSADISGALVTHDNVTITADNKFFKVQTSGAVDKFTVDTDNGNTTIAGTLAVTGDVTASSDLTVTGNLIVNGTTTTVNSTVVTLDDPIITLGGNTAPASNDGKDRGVEFRYYDSTAKVGFFGLDRSSLEYVFLTAATNTNEVHSGTDGDLRAGSLNLTGSGTALDVDANANIDGTLTVDGQIISQVTSGPALVIPTTNKINNLNADLLDSMTTASANTASTIVNRDASGNFSAGTITADLTGNADTATTLETARTITVDGVVDGSVSFNGSTDVTITTTYNDADITALAAMAGTGLVARTAANTYAQRSVTATASSGITITNADGVSGDITINVASASTNAANNLVLRDASGNFSAGTITADLTGDVTGDLTGDVTGNVTGDVTGNLTGSASQVNTGSGGGTTLYLASFSQLGAGSGRTIFSNNTATLTYSNPDWTLTVDKFAGDLTGDVTGNASTASAVSVSQSGSQTDHFVAIAANTAGSGTTSIRADAGLKFNTGTNVLTVTGGVTADVTGNLTGDVTGNVTGDVTGTVSDVSNHDTDDISEGTTNLYYTEARFDTSLVAKTTDDLSEGSANLYYTDARADARIAAADTDDLSEGSTNLYYTEARVQTKLDDAFAQLQAMLNNLATTTTLTMALSGDPTPGAVVTVGVDDGGGGGFTAGTAVATTGGTGSGLTVDTTVVGGVITAAAVNAGGSDYLVTDTVTITNPNAGKALTMNLATLVSGTGYSAATGVATTGGTGTGLTVDIVGTGGITNVTINNGGTGYTAGDTITISGGSGDATIDIATVATNATLSLTDITTMEVGGTVTGATSGTTGIITALGTNQITVDNVDGFFKVGEVVSANDVTTLTISSFA